MATTIANLKTVLSADASQFKNELDAANKKLAALKELGKEALGAFGIGLGAAAAVQFLQSSVAEAEEAEQAQAKLQTALAATGNQAGLTGAQLTEYAQQLSAATAVQDDVILGVEAMLVSFGNIRGSILKQAIPAVLDLAKFTGKDAASAAVILGKALADPADALGALSKAGVVFTDQQKRSIKAMVEAGDVAGAQAAIIKELGSSFGGAAERMATASERLQTNLADLKQEIGGFGGDVGGKGGLIDLIAGNVGRWKTVVESLSQMVGLFKDLGNLVRQEVAQRIPWLAQADKVLDRLGGMLSIKGAAQEITPDDAAGPAGPSQAAIDAMDAFNEKLKRQIETFGKSHDEIMLYDLQQKELGQDVLSTTNSLLAQKAALEAGAQAGSAFAASQRAIEAAGKAIDDTLKRLEESFDTTGMSAAGLAAYRLQLQGASEDQIAYAMSVVNATEELKKFLSESSTIESSGVSDAVEEATRDIQDLTDALTDGRIEWDAYNSSLDKLQDALGKKLEDAGKRLHDSLRTPVEKAEDDIRDLNTLLEANVITAEDYQRRLAEIQDTLREPDLMDLNTSNPALEFGTAAAFSASRGSGMERREVEDAKAHEKLEEIRKLLDRMAGKDGVNVVVKQF